MRLKQEQNDAHDEDFEPSVSELLMSAGKKDPCVS